MCMEKNEVSIVKKSASISLLVVFGKVLGFVKQAVVARAFGSNGLTDVFFAADGYASMFGQIMTQTVGPTVLTQYIHVDERGDHEGAKRLVRESYLFFIVLSLVLIAINTIFADQICEVIGISYSRDQLSELKYFLIAMLPVILFTTMIGVSSGYLDSYNHYLPGRLTTFFFSVSIITFVLLFEKKLFLRSLLYGFMLGYFLHMVLMLWLVVPKVGIGISNPFRNPVFISMMKRFLPLVIGFSVVDLGHLVDKIVASSLESGSVSSLYYGQAASSDIVSSVIVTSVGSVLLTSITKNVASKTSINEIKAKVQNISSIMTFIIIGINALYIVEGSDLIRFLFQRGKFDGDNTTSVTTVALYYSIGFIFTANRDILVKTHYAFHDTKSPMINSIAGVGLNVILSIALSRLIGVSGVALATSISMIFVFVLSTITLKKHIHGYIIERDFWFDCLKSLLAFCVSLAIGKGLFTIMSNSHYFLRLVVIGVTMCIVHFLAGAAIKEKAAQVIVEKGKSILIRR